MAILLRGLLSFEYQTKRFNRLVLIVLCVYKMLIERQKYCGISEKF